LFGASPRPVKRAGKFFPDSPASLAGTITPNSPARELVLVRRLSEITALYKKWPHRQCVTRQLWLDPFFYKQFQKVLYLQQGTIIALPGASEAMPAADASEIGEI
jgi:hypothetical protein